MEFQTYNELQESGDEETLTEFFDGVLQSETLADLIADQRNEQNSNLILINGAGGCRNMLRLQSPLSHLQSKLNADQYLDKLRGAMEKILKEGKRIRIN